VFPGLPTVEVEGEETVATPYGVEEVPVSEPVEIGGIFDERALTQQDIDEAHGDRSISGDYLMEDDEEEDQDDELEEDNLLTRWSIEAGNPFRLSNPAVWKDDKKQESQGGGGGQGGGGSEPSPAHPEPEPEQGGGGEEEHPA